MNDARPDPGLPIVGESGPEIFIGEAIHPLNQIREPNESLLDRWHMDKSDAYFLVLIVLLSVPLIGGAVYLAVIEHGAHVVIRSISLIIAFFTIPALIVHWLSRTPGGPQ